MDIQLTIAGRRDLSAQMYQQLRAAIVEGRLPSGSRLPSTRDLARQLGVSRKTTLEVYERLAAEGFLDGRTGDGTFVAEKLVAAPSSGIARGMSALRPARIWRRVPEALSMPRPAERLPYDYLGGVTDKTLFQPGPWRRCVAHALRSQARGRGIYRDPAGEQELRLAVARYIRFSRGVACQWQEVIATERHREGASRIHRPVRHRGVLRGSSGKARLVVRL